ncbi:MAG: hypothetical protein ACYCYE_16090 [Clostridia bacterium]
MSNRIIDLLNMTYIQLKHRLDEVSEYEQTSDLLNKNVSIPWSS